jgi:hypothetical protein
MKTEQFDDAFRRKIGGISPPFDDAEIDRINDYVNINKTPTFWGSYSKIATYALGTVLVTGIIASILTQHYENKDLRSQLISLQNKIDKSATPSVIMNTDTVYINRNQPSYLSLNSTIKKKMADIQNSRNTSVSFEQLSPAQKDKILTSYLLKKRGDVANVIDNVNVLFQEKNNLQPSDKQEDRIVSQEGSSKISAKSNTYFPENSLAKNINKNLTFQQENSENSEENNNSLSLRNLTYRVGLGTDFYNKNLSMGLWAEIFFHKNWSVNVGLKSTEYREDDIRSEDGFEYKKGKPFRPNYAPTLPKQFNIEDIRSSNMIVQIPLNLNYHAPLKNGFAVIVGAGTVFDIAGKNHINFNFKDPTRSGVTESSNPSLNSGVNTTFFNNAELSVGVEKRFNRFVFQANPYWTTQLKNVNYKPDLSSWGLRVRGLYNFGQR